LIRLHGGAALVGVLAAMIAPPTARAADNSLTLSTNPSPSDASGGSGSHKVVVHGKVVKGTITDQAKSWVFTHNQRQDLTCRTGTVRFSARAA
jgi:hypothetical protein